MNVATLPWDHITDIILAGVLGGFVGIERDLSGRPAGLRTNLIVAVASCLFTILSMEGFGASEGTDTSRVAAQIVTGIGFLGAGALIHQGDRVLGLTTAADIWLVAAIGMATATGMYVLALFVTIFVLACSVLLAPVSDWFDKVGAQRMRKKGHTVVKER